MRIFDAHAHVSAWSVSAARAMRELGVSDLCNISYPRDGASAEALDAYERDLFPEDCVWDVRIHQVVSLPFGMIEQSPDDFLALSLGKIDAIKRQAGVVGVKIWKDVGMARRDPDGRPLTIDNKLLEPIFAAIADARLVCIVHTGDPPVAWSPDASKHEYYRRHPEFAMSERPDFPAFRDLIERFEDVVETWREITFVGAHFASLDHNFDELTGLLSRNANLLVDSAGRHDAIIRRSGEDFKALLDDFPERVIYGSDWTIGRHSTAAEIADSGHRRQLRLQQAIEVLDEADLMEGFFWKNACRTFGRRHED